jgi:hypothetical protein
MVGVVSAERRYRIVLSLVVCEATEASLPTAQSVQDAIEANNAEGLEQMRSRLFDALGSADEGEAGLGLLSVAEIIAGEGARLWVPSGFDRDVRFCQRS